MKQTNKSGVERVIKSLRNKKVRKRTPFLGLHAPISQVPVGGEYIVLSKEQRDWLIAQLESMVTS